MESPLGMTPMVSLHEGAQNVFSVIDDEEHRQRQPKRRQQKGYLFRTSDEEEQSCFNSHKPEVDVILKMWETTDVKMKYTAEQATALAMEMSNNALTDVLFKESLSLNTTTKRIGFMLLLSLICYGLELIIFGTIPLGQPDGSMRQKLVWLLITNPVTYMLLSVLLAAVFYAIVDERRPFRPFRHYFPIMLAQYIFQIVLMCLIYPFTDTFILMGLIPFLTCITFTLISLKYMERTIWLCQCTYYSTKLREFRPVCINIAAYVACLAVWTIVYRQATSYVQVIMPYVLLVLVFGFKKWMLGLSDKYPLVIGMLLAGLTLENLDDTFQTLVFPVVSKPGVGFLSIGLRKFFENAAYLLFFTESWMRFRVWIKDFLKRFFTCRMSQTAVVPITEDVDVNDRGHSNQMQGYFRRQAQFFLYKIISQVVAYVFFLVVTPVLRNGTNSNFYPLSEKSTLFLNNQPGVTVLEGEAYRNSIIFTSALLIDSLLSGVAGFYILRRYREVIFNQIRNLYKPLFTSPLYLTLLFVIVCTNQLLALAVVQYHNRIWYFDVSNVVDQ
eukprot:m.102699 g.102699  ORF g.102699 m.102699 type:complete len:555 (+) comp15698_c0_seq1:130-1794(+)